MTVAVFWMALLVVILSYMTLWYGVSAITSRLDVVDTAWGLGFVLVAWVSLALRGTFSGPQVVSAILVSIWGIRLAVHIGVRNWRKPADDARYRLLRENWGDRQHLKAYTNVFILQGLLIVLISTPMIALAFARNPANALSWIGWAIWLFGIGFETFADRQLTTFIAHRKKGSHAILDRGLWRYSRHPNYFGEIAAWWGAAIVALSSGYWQGLIGALCITLLITKISGIPPLEKRYQGNKDYAAYSRRTPLLIPLPPKEPRSL